MAYLDAVVGDVGPASSPERREMFLHRGQRDDLVPPAEGPEARARATATPTTTRTTRAAATAGRSVEGVPYDAEELGPWAQKLAPSLAKSVGYVVKTNELRSLQYFNRAPGSFAVASRCSCRTADRRAATPGAPHERCVAGRPAPEGADGARRRAARSGRARRCRISSSRTATSSVSASSTTAPR